jgi:hypothetical protein
MTIIAFMLTLLVGSRESYEQMEKGWPKSKKAKKTRRSKK